MITIIACLVLFVGCEGFPIWVALSGIPEELTKLQ